MSNSPIVARINGLLAEKGIPKQKFYEDCGITSASYSLWNKGKTTPRMKNLDTIAQYLGTTTEYLLTGIEETKKAPTPESERNRDRELNPAFFRLKQGLEPYDISESDVDFLLKVYKAHIEKNEQE